MRRVDLPAQVATFAHAVSEPTGKLFHLADGVGHLRSYQHSKVPGKQAVAVSLGRLVVMTPSGELFHLAEDPRIGGRSAADHHRITASFANHSRGILGGIDIAVADDGDAHRLFHRANHAPVGATVQSLHPRAGVHGDGRSEEHTSELQSLAYLVCRLLLEKKKRIT